jgi:hypothetical protein
MARGQVAQPVEQRTENPCVGGSIPPLATLAVLAGIALAGCGADTCETLCGRVATRLNQCLPEWSATWADLGASSRAAFRVQCTDEWSGTRADLELREIRLAEDACQDAIDELATIRDCDVLRVLYLE